ncbi:MAG: T9SS type A sorting domain-containing protein [Phaeodactylibacter sp.]|nr:T9SS type A sorting domain-containing protein [Phaeodactylibacter sp.]
MQIYDLLGNLLIQQTFNGQTHLNTASLSTGTYFIRIQNSKGRYTDKLIRNWPPHSPPYEKPAVALLRQPVFLLVPD